MCNLKKIIQKKQKNIQIKIMSYNDDEKNLTKITNKDNIILQA